MKSSHSKSIIDYIANVIKQYKSVHNEHKSYPYKIVDKEVDKHNQERFVVQVAGKSVFLKLTPVEIAADDKMLRGFSPLDVRTITYFACKEKFAQDKKHTNKQSIFKLVAQAFSRKFKREMVTLQNTQTQEFVTQSASDVSKNASLVEQLDAKDAHMIGYTAGVESVTSENEQKAEAKQSAE